MKSDDKQVSELALAVFKRYHGYIPGEGGWTLERDTLQLTRYITPLIEVWLRRMRGMDTVEIDWGNALDCARSIGIHDRPYVGEIRHAYNDVRKEMANAEKRDSQQSN